MQKDSLLATEGNEVVQIKRHALVFKAFFFQCSLSGSVF